MLGKQKTGAAGNFHSMDSCTRWVPGGKP
jgi:hypothetical protein